MSKNNSRPAGVVGRVLEGGRAILARVASGAEGKRVTLVGRGTAAAAAAAACARHGHTGRVHKGNTTTKSSGRVSERWLD